MNKVIQQVGVIPYIKDGSTLKFVLITPKHYDNIWIFPKGHLEPYLNATESAEMEAIEEAGVEGLIAAEPFDNYQYTKLGKTYNVDMYLLEVTHLSDSWKEDDVRKRRIVKTKKAMDMVHHEAIAQMIKQAAKQLAPK